MYPASLENSCLNMCVKQFTGHRFKNFDDIELAHKYIYSKYPFYILKKIVSKIRYSGSAQLTLLFLPYLIAEGKLYISDQNILEAVYWLESHSELEAELCSVYKVSVNVNGANNHFKLSNLLIKMPNVKIFKFFSCTSDEILARIGMSCKKIEIFDSREDAASTVTDAGLAFISHCKNLRTILFSNIADEYDYEDKFRFSAKGISMLLYTLPKLTRLECPEYLLRDALQFLYHMNFKNNSLPLCSVNLSFPGIPGSTISLLPYMCPNITTLSVYINDTEELIIANSLKRLLYLQKLQISFEGLTGIQELDLPNYGHRLKYLILKLQTFTNSDVTLLCRSCPNLEVLVLQLHSYSKNKLNIDKEVFPYFPKLVTLELVSRVSLACFLILNLCGRAVKELYVPYTSTEGFGQATVESIIAQGGWSYLEILVLPVIKSFCSDFVIALLTALKNLKLLVVVFANSADESRVKTFIMDRKLTVRICDYDDIILPHKLFDPVME